MSQNYKRKAKKRSRPVAHRAPAKATPASGATMGHKPESAAHRNRPAASRGTRPAVRPDSKLARLVALLGQSGGASLDALMAATGWQAHSVRGAIAGAVKKKLGLRIESDRVDGARVYRLVDTR